MNALNEVDSNKTYLLFWLPLVPPFVPLDLKTITVQYRHLIPAPVAWTSASAGASAWFYKHQWITCQKISEEHQ